VNIDVFLGSQESTLAATEVAHGTDRSVMVGYVFEVAGLLDPNPSLCLIVILDVADVVACGRDI
jgi:hypothetical protein